MIKNVNCQPVILVSEKLFLPTAYVVRREGNVFTRVCPSIHQSVCPHRGGYPSQVQPGGYPCQGVPHLRYPPSDLAGGYPLPGGTPTRVPPSDLARGVPHLGYSPSDLTRGGTPCQGVPHLRSPHQTWPRGAPPAGGYPTSGTPCQTWLGGTSCRGYPTSGTPIRPGQGVPPAGGYPTSGTPPVRPGGGGTPLRQTDGVLDTPRSVCLLRSRRRTFLFFVTYAHYIFLFLENCSILDNIVFVFDFHRYLV